MIRARALVRDGLIVVEISGHAHPRVCAAASMICQAAALGLEDLAKQWPREIVFTGDEWSASLDRRRIIRKKRR